MLQANYNIHWISVAPIKGLRTLTQIIYKNKHHKSDALTKQIMLLQDNDLQQ